MSDVKINFDELPESKETRSVNKAGVHLKFHIEETEFVPKVVKDDKSISEYVKILLKGETEQFLVTRFAPPANPDEVKFTSGHYENGKEVRKKTPEEQIQIEFNNLYFFYEQLMKALGGTKESLDKFKSQIRNVPLEDLFKKMYDVFFTMYPVEKVKTKKINFKALWNNNDKAKTSFLNLAKATANNIVFAAYVNDTNPVLAVGTMEEKLLVRKYSPLDRAPSTNSTEVNGGGDATNGNADPGAYTPIATSDADLF